MSVLDKYSDDELFDILGSNVEDEIRSRGYEYGWHKKVVYAGCIYILVNPAFPNLVKIGYADNVTKRVKTLNSNSGLPDPYHVYATYKVKKRLEDLKLHDLIDTLDPDLRHARNREFYEMTPDAAFGLLSAIAQINGDEDLLEQNPFADDFFGGVIEVKEVKERKAQPPFNFYEFGINDGEQLVFYDARNKVARPEITAVVVGKRKIECDGVETSLSKKAQEVMELKTTPRGTEYWMWNDRQLVDIYQEKYPAPKPKKK